MGKGRMIRKTIESCTACLAMAVVAAMVLGVVGVSTAGAVGPPPGSEFSITSFVTEVKDRAGVDEARAGAHPYSARAEFELSSYDTGYSAGGRSPIRPVEDPKTIITKLPPGFSGNPTAAARCPLVFVPRGTLQPMMCPDESVVGYIYLDGETPLSTPIVNVEAEDGYPAEFAFSEAGFVYTLYPELRSDGDYGLNMVVPAATFNFITRVDATFCSYGVVTTVPGSTVGDARFRCKEPNESGASAQPFLTNPATECTDQAPFTDLEIDSWQSPGVFKSARAVSPLITDCETLLFEPRVDIAPTTTEPDAPTGLNVDMTFPQEDNDQGQAPPALKKAVVTLPEGMTINPSGANGLAACADGDLRLKSKEPMSCPEASKVGSVRATSPLLEEAINGGVYIRSQNSGDPESGEMFRLALVLQNKKRGIDVRLPGQIRVDAQTGRLVTTFDNNPELPVDSIKLRFKEGPRAPLTTPPTCGEKRIDTVLTSWGKQTKSLQSTFNVDCTEARGSFGPSFAAGTASSRAGASSPFSLAVSRQGDDGELKSFRSIKLPEGLLGDVGSVPWCGEVQAAAGTCAEASRVGHVQVAAGAGPSPLWVPLAGKEPTAVYLTGPYKGAPYGLSIVVPAQAGPFDLGRVVVRSALHVDERTAAITSGVDETRLIDTDGTVTEVLPEALPRILKGVVLNQREIRVILDRKDFMVNPTDCSERQITAQLSSFEGDTADVGNRFTAVNCALLGFSPKFRAKILNKGRKSTRRSFNPKMRFTVTPRAGHANIGRAAVTLPHSVILDQSHIRTICTRAQFAARNCPEASVYGYAKAFSPLLRGPVEGPVYLGSSPNKLPDLIADLDGEVRIVLQGRIDTAKGGRIRNTFDSVPDAPVSKFVLTMRGGKRGILVNSTDLCRSSERGVANFTGQNNKRSSSRPKIGLAFKGCAKVRKAATRKAAARKGAGA